MIRPSLSVLYVVALSTAMIIAGFPAPALAQQEDEIRRLKDENAQLQIQLLALQLKIADQAKAQKDLETVLAAQRVEAARLLKELDTLRKANRDADVLKLMNDVRKHKQDAEAAETKAQFALRRMEDLLRELREARLEIARLSSKEKEGPGKQPDPRAPNPPPVKVNGKVTKVEGDLIRIDLGADHGLKKGHTLEVYRLAPEAKYLGMIRIVDTTEHNSVGRLLTAGKGKGQPAIREGDAVGSDLRK